MHSLRAAFAAPILILLAQTSPTDAAWEKLADFEAHTVGTNVSSAGGWVSNGTPTTTPVLLDPTGAANQVLAVQAFTSARVYLNNTTARIPNNSTATLFLRFRFNGQKNYSFGMSDVAAPADFGAFESQFNHNNAANDARMRDAAAFTPLSPASPHQPNTWYNIWMVINNSTDTTTVYIDSTTPPGASTSALQSNGAKTAFTFRNSGGGTVANDLLSFAVLTGGAGGTDEGHNGELYIDDIWIDKAGQNLVNPVSPASNIVVANDDAIEVGVQGALDFDPKLNDTTTFGTLNPASLAIVNAPGSGTATVDPASGKILYRHTGSNPGADSFTYTISNSAGASDTGTVNVSISGALRLANHTLQLPQEPPPSAGALQLVDAFPGLTFDGIVGLASVPGSPEKLLVAATHGPSSGSNSAVWMIPNTASATPVKKELFRVDSLCPTPFVRGRGIYSVVCHPEFATNGHIIVCYQGKVDGFPIPISQIPNLEKNGVPNSTITCTLRISRFTITPAQLNILLNSTDATLLTQTRDAIVATELRYLNLAEQDLFHSINDCHFDEDGYLYVSFGDEGDQGEPFRNAQFITKDQYTAIIRIDVDRRPGTLEPNPHYAIVVNPDTGKANFTVPADNPYVGNSVTFNGVTYTPAHPDFAKIRTEVWATGLRNPFKFHLDRVGGQTHAWVGDVGRDLWEEVSVLRKGDNAGWSYYEGNAITGIGHSIQPSVHRAPEYDYPHNSGNNCVIGGVLYRGSTYEQPLHGKYIFGDHGSGRIWTLDPAVSGSGKVQQLGVGTVGQVVDFHVDPLTGHILIAQYQSSKRIYRLVEGTPTAGNFPQKLSETGAFADLATLTPNPGVVPYEPNLKFWSDYADKSRWFAIKNTTDQMTYSRDGAWSFPQGMVFVKHFDMELNRSFPGTNRKRLETRFLVRNAGGLYGVSYRWNDQGTDATLVGAGGVEFDLTIREGGTNNNGTVTGGTTHIQRWGIPSRGECITCHNPNAGHVLSLTTQQLNKAGQMGTVSGNYLELLSQSTYLAGLTDSPAALPRFYRPGETHINLDERVRSYLAVNCSYCHQPNSGVVESWDARGHLTIDQMRILYGLPVSETYHGPDDRLVIPGDKLKSVIWNRIQARNFIGNGTFNGFSQMPPLATNAPDDEGIALLSQWIDFHANVAPAMTAGSPNNLSVEENSALGTSLATFSATDPDVRNGQADQASLTFTIAGGNPHSLFSIEPSTGALRINGLLDFESISHHTLQIAVSDNFAANPRVTLHDVSVQVLDVANEDANQNGIPDWWEISFTPGLAANGDFDKDGIPDFFEFLGGGNPTQPDADTSTTLNLRVTSYVPGPVPGYTVAWRARNGMLLSEHYFARVTPALDGSWTTLGSSSYEILSITPAGPGFSEVVLFVPATGTSFFKLSNQSGN
jgi:glucose/arabinose dehydrogenase